MSWISVLMKTNPKNKEMKDLGDKMAHSTIKVGTRVSGKD
jgi:hypothetical protein